MNGADRPLVCALRGPVTLITLGVLFALNNFTPYGFQQTWPVLLIVFGLMSMMRRAAMPPSPPRPYPNPYVPPPPYTPPPPPPPHPAGGSYRQTHYGDSGTPQASSGPAKGGFGSSGQNPGGAK
jgi:hypothetical protein